MAYFDPMAGFRVPELMTQTTGMPLGSGMFGLDNNQGYNANVQMPAAAGAQGFGLNIPTAQMGLSALGSLGNLYGAFQANSLAKKQFEFTKGVTNTNLANSIQSYNTALADRATARAFTQGSSNSDRDDYIRRNSLSRQY